MKKKEELALYAKGAKTWRELIEPCSNFFHEHGESLLELRIISEEEKDDSIKNEQGLTKIIQGARLNDLLKGNAIIDEYDNTFGTNLKPNSDKNTSRMMKTTLIGGVGVAASIPLIFLIPPAGLWTYLISSYGAFGTVLTYRVKETLNESNAKRLAAWHAPRFIDEVRTELGKLEDTSNSLIKTYENIETRIDTSNKLCKPKEYEWMSRIPEQESYLEQIKANADNIRESYDEFFDKLSQHPKLVKGK